MRYGSWWAVQWSTDWFFSLGIHINIKRRITNGGVRFGPYVDLHLICAVISLGVNPIYAGEEHLKTSVGRGGIPCQRQP